MSETTTEIAPIVATSRLAALREFWHYFSQSRGAVIGLDVVDEMMAACRANLAAAEAINPWFKENFVDLRRGDALALPMTSVPVAFGAV